MAFPLTSGRCRFASGPIDQPITLRDHRSRIVARCSHPWPVWNCVTSAAHKSSGPEGLKLRRQRSGARASPGFDLLQRLRGHRRPPNRRSRKRWGSSGEEHSGMRAFCSSYRGSGRTRTRRSVRPRPWRDKRVEALRCDVRERSRE